MARFQVTRGAVWQVPISGARVPYLTGQGTRLVHVPMGAAKSEPRATRRPAPRGAPTPCAHPGASPAARCTRGAGGCRVVPRCAHCLGGDECIYGVFQ